MSQIVELRWLDTLISFVFKLLAKLAEPFLAFGLIISGIDYLMHGQFLADNAALMQIWVVTQALALEGSGGIALAMSFEAQAEGDLLKARVQRILALSLLLVGGVMFFSELAATVPGFRDITSSGWYIYPMSALRVVVSLGYIAICRTREYCFSGSSPAQPTQIEAPSLQEQVAEQVEEAMRTLRSAMQAQIIEMRNEMRGQIREIPAMVQAAAQSMQFEVDPEKLNAQVETSIAQALNSPAFTARIEASVAHAFSARQARQTDELTQSKIPVGSAQKRIHRYIREQRERGIEPTLEEIMAACDCAKNTAVKYRREVEAAQCNDGFAVQR